MGLGGGVGGDGVDDVFDLGGGGEGLEVGGGGLGGKILGEVVRGEEGGDEAFFELDGEIVFVVDDEGVEDFGAGAERKMRGGGGVGVDGFEGEDCGVVLVAAGGNVGGDVGDFQQGGAVGFWLDEGADTLDAAEMAFLLEFAQRAVDGHAGGADGGDEFVFGGDSRAVLPLARLDAGEEVGFDALVEREGFDVVHLYRQSEEVFERLLEFFGDFLGVDVAAVLDELVALGPDAVDGGAAGGEEGDIEGG